MILDYIDVGRLSWSLEVQRYAVAPGPKVEVLRDEQGLLINPDRFGRAMYRGDAR